MAAFAFYWLILLIGKTIKFETVGWENLKTIENAGHIPIYTFWHNRIFLGTYFFRNRNIAVMSSISFDAEYTGRFIKRFGYGTIRGSSTRGGLAAMAEMIRLMRKGMPMGFTIDGPRGPKYVANMGACLLAKKTGNPMMAFSIETKKFWEVNSWDRVQIPKPFSKACVFIAPPIYVPGEIDKDALESKRLELQNALDELVARGAEWRESEN